MKAKITTTTVSTTQYELLNPLLLACYKEIQELSKKKSESPLNKSKVTIINRILEPIKEFQKEEPVYSFLDILDSDDLPTYSDVALILSQYIKAMGMFYAKYCLWSSISADYTWSTSKE